jgi:hypothetical protein
VLRLLAVGNAGPHTLRKRNMTRRKEEGGVEGRKREAIGPTRPAAKASRVVATTTLFSGTKSRTSNTSTISNNGVISISYSISIGRPSSSIGHSEEMDRLIGAGPLILAPAEPGTARRPSLRPCECAPHQSYVLRRPRLKKSLPKTALLDRHASGVAVVVVERELTQHCHAGRPFLSVGPAEDAKERG